MEPTLKSCLFQIEFMTFLPGSWKKVFLPIFS